MEDRYGFKPEYAPSAPSFPLNFPNHNMYPLLYNPPQPHANSGSVFSSNLNFSPQRKNPAYQWVDSSIAYGSIPPSAVQGGMDIDGHPIYVGRAYHQGDLIPAKVIPSKNIAYVAHDGEEHPVENYQILCQQRFEWIPSQGGDLPPGAIPGGHTSEGEPLYIGRVFHDGAQTVGKVHPTHGVCYIPFGGKEVAYPAYETLVLRM